MDKITSFTVDHTKLKEGLYVSRTDRFGNETITTFDIGMKRPYTGDVLSTTAALTIEHLGATYLRNDEFWKQRTVYFGPMGCRTGFYIVFHGELNSHDVLDVIEKMFAFILDYEGDVPGASEKECGNYRDLSLAAAKPDAAAYAEILKTIDESRMVYPD
jgi:S-ribosylhomocysteine lyase